MKFGSARKQQKLIFASTSFRNFALKKKIGKINTREKKEREN